MRLVCQLGIIPGAQCFLNGQLNEMKEAINDKCLYKIGWKHWGEKMRLIVFVIFLHKLTVQFSLDAPLAPPVHSALSLLLSYLTFLKLESNGILLIFLKNTVLQKLLQYFQVSDLISYFRLRNFIVIFSYSKKLRRKE